MKVKFEDQVPSYSFPTSPFAAYSKPSPNVNCSAHNYNSRQNMGVAKGKGAKKMWPLAFKLHHPKEAPISPDISKNYGD